MASARGSFSSLSLALLARRSAPTRCSPRPPAPLGARLCCLQRRAENTGSVRQRGWALLLLLCSGPKAHRHPAWVQPLQLALASTTAPAPAKAAAEHSSPPFAHLLSGLLRRESTEFWRLSSPLAPLGPRSSSWPPAPAPLPGLAPSLGPGERGASGVAHLRKEGRTGLQRATCGSLQQGPLT